MILNVFHISKRSCAAHPRIPMILHGSPGSPVEAIWWPSFCWAGPQMWRSSSGTASTMEPSLGSLGQHGDGPKKTWEILDLNGGFNGG